MDDYDIAYRHKDKPGIAWELVVWHSYGDAGRPDDGWGEFVMVGDDREYKFRMDSMTVLLPGEYCGDCGQVGCNWSALVGQSVV